MFLEYPSILTIQIDFIELLLKDDIFAAICKMRDNGCDIDENIIDTNQYKTNDTIWLVQKQGITKFKFLNNS